VPSKNKKTLCPHICIKNSHTNEWKNTFFKQKSYFQKENCQYLISASYFSPCNHFLGTFWSYGWKKICRMFRTTNNRIFFFLHERAKFC
jgi:hypothetical protein